MRSVFKWTIRQGKLAGEQNRKQNRAISILRGRALEMLTLVYIKVFFEGEMPLATALPVLSLHVAIFDFGYGSLKTPLNGFLALRGMLV
jgi:hypothetical protein